MRYLPCAVVVLALAGCSGPELDSQDTSQDAPRGNLEQALQRTQSQLVARVSVTPTHVVEFYEFQPGQIGIYERGSLDSRDKPLDQSSWSGMSIAEIHERLAPGQAVPEALRQAEQRRAAYKEALGMLPQEALISAAIPMAATRPPLKPAPELHVIPEPSQPPQQLLARSAARDQAPGAAADEREVTQFDAASDAAWWQSNFCSWAGGMDSVWCPTNVTWAHSGSHPTMYYEAAGMSASSVASAVVWVDQYTNAWVNVFAQNAQPRTWWRWASGAESTFRSGVDGQQPQPWIHFAERYRAAITTFGGTNWFPSDAEWGFTNDIQGMTHDSGNWYFTRSDYGLDTESDYGQLAKAPVNFNLNNTPPNIYGEPSSWINAGFKHFGDLTIRGSQLFIAMDDSGGHRCGVGVWQGGYVGFGAVPGLSSCGWVAYNPRDGLFYFNDGSTTLRRYSISVSGSTVTAQEYLPKVTLTSAITSWQGGEFSPRGILYVARGYKENPMVVYGVDINSGAVYTRAYWTVSDPGDWEAEGLTLWDLTGGQAPGSSGHMHVQLLDNDFWDDDNLWIAHLAAADPSRL